MATSWILITPATLPLLWGLEIPPGPSSPPLAHTQPSSHEDDEAEAENKQHGDTSSRDGPLGHSCSRPRFPCRRERHLERIPTLTPLLSTQRGILPLTCRVQPLGSPPLSEPQPFAEGHGLSSTTSPAHTLPRNFSSPWSQLLLHPQSLCNRPYARPQKNHEALSPVDISDRQTDSESLGMLKGLAPPSSQGGCLNLLGMASVGSVTQNS